MVSLRSVTRLLTGICVSLSPPTKRAIPGIIAKQRLMWIIERSALRLLQAKKRQEVPLKTKKKSTREITNWVRMKVTKHHFASPMIYGGLEIFQGF